MVVQCSQMFANSLTVFNEHLFDVCEDISKCEKRLCLDGDWISGLYDGQLALGSGFRSWDWLDHLSLSYDGQLFQFSLSYFFASFSSFGPS